MSSAGEKRRRDEDRAEPRTREPEASGGAAPEPQPKFFLAVFQGGFSEARIFRAYPEADGISFVYAGLPGPFIDLEMARGAGRGGWKVKAADALKSGLVKAGGAGLVVLGLVIAIVGRMAARGGANVTDIIGFLLVFITVFGFAIVLAMTMSVRRIAARVKVLEAMSREELREEADTNKKSFRATADNVSDVCIDPPPGGAGTPGCAARLSFKHDPTGKWKLTLVARKDARLAARAFRALLGEDEVEVNVSLKKE